jgi:hypothetical protein
MEDQFADQDDELDRYLRMNIEDIYKQSNSLPFWRDHQNKFPALFLLARRLFS